MPSGSVPPRRLSHRGRRPRPHIDPAAATRLLRVDHRPAAPAAQLPDARFEAAAARPPAEGGRPADAAVLELLATAPVTGVGRIVYSSNACFLVEFDARHPDDPGRPLRAVYKPAAGERPLWDFPHRTLHHREVASYAVDAALDLGIVPPTVLRDGPAGPGSMQLFVETVDRELNEDEEAALQTPLHACAALDVLINNADRKSAHLLVEEGPRLRGIDNGLSFLPYPRQRTVLIELGGSPLDDDTAERVRALEADRSRRTLLLDWLAVLLERHEVDAFAARLTELAADPVYPVLDPWDGRPFEWW